MALSTYEEIVTNFSSPTLVLAGPGAGKTYLLADRIKRLVDSGINNEKITVLTFGKEASRHMKEELLNQKGHFKLTYDQLPHISTMHSLGLSIVKEKPRTVGLLKTDLEIQTDEEVKRLIFRDAALICDYSEQDGAEAIECKQKEECRENEDERRCRICKKYREIMSKCNYLDYDDQIHFACRILENKSDILAKYQNQCKHLLVDEYQDINAAQYRLIELLSRIRRNGLFVVGDDAQSIYGFRGGDPKFILQFNEDYADAEVATLATSRRCQKNIINNSFKVLKSYYPGWSGEPDLEYFKPDGDPPYVWQLPSELTEAKKVASLSFSAVNEKKRVLVLVPKKEFFPFLTKALQRRQVPYTCSIDLLPDRLKIAKKLMDWVISPNDNFKTRLVIEDLINIGIAKVPGAKKDARCSEDTIRKRILEETNIANLWNTVNKDTSLYSAVDLNNEVSKTLEKINSALSDIEHAYNNFSRDNKGKFAKHISINTGIWVDPKKMAEDILSIANLLENDDSMGDGSVKLLTMRKAKGLEADIVIMVGLEDDILPNPWSADIEEEARLFYVSMTRAKEKLYLFHSYKRPRNISFGPGLTNKKVSRFVKSLGIDSKYIRSN